MSSNSRCSERCEPPQTCTADSAAATKLPNGAVIAPRLAVNGTTVDSSYQPTPEELEGTAIITMASDDDAGLMALALMQSLRDVETRVPRLIVMLMKGGRASCHKAPGGCNYTDPGHVLAKDITDALVGLGVELRFMSPLPITEFTNQISGGAQAFWGMAFNKLTIFGMTEFRKLLWLDSDTLMLRNVDYLLVQPSFTAAFTNDCNNRAAPAKISGGMWVVEPSKARMDEILELTRTGKLGEGQEWRLGDMEIVLYLFAKFTRASREGGLWPKSYDIRQGRVPGLELFSSDYAKGGARADVPAGPRSQASSPRRGPRARSPGSRWTCDTTIWCRSVGTCPIGSWGCRGTRQPKSAWRMRSQAGHGGTGPPRWRPSACPS